MSGGLHLTITTPIEVLVDQQGVQAIRASDDSGAFGILAGHADYLTALSACVLRWRGDGGAAQYCALSGGVLTVTGGQRVAVACREGVLGEDPAALEQRVAELRAAELEAEKQARVEDTRLHAAAVRQFVRFRKSGQPGAFDHPEGLPEAQDGRAAQ
jgi:F-type H+-transporting ATPase subunit epsilon